MARPSLIERRDPGTFPRSGTWVARRGRGIGVMAERPRPTA